MSDADLARLAIAKRAYQATQPSSTEVQTGVRRARLSLRRPKTRRSWFSKALVLVVIAVGGLAYAKPHALGDLVGDVLPRIHRAKPVAKLGPAALSEARDAIVTPPRLAAYPRIAAAPKDIADIATPPETVPSRATEPPFAKDPPPLAPALDAAEPAAKVVANISDARAASAKAGTRIWRTVGNAGGAPSSRDTERISDSNGSASFAGSDDPHRPGSSGNVSDWGRVGQALARGDETRALEALRELSESDDRATRDKADLGRAQLLMADGNRDGACSLARALTHRRAGGRIERQAQALLKGCSR